MNECQHKASSRPGLYVMVIVIFFRSCGISTDIDAVRSELRRIDSRLQVIEQQLQQEAIK